MVGHVAGVAYGLKVGAIEVKTPFLGDHVLNPIAVQSSTRRILNLHFERVAIGIAYPCHGGLRIAHVLHGRHHDHRRVITSQRHGYPVAAHIGHNTDFQIGRRIDNFNVGRQMHTLDNVRRPARTCGPRHLDVIPATAFNLQGFNVVALASNQ